MSTKQVVAVETWERQGRGRRGDGTLETRRILQFERVQDERFPS